MDKPDTHMLCPVEMDAGKYHVFYTRTLLAQNGYDIVNPILSLNENT